MNTTTEEQQPKIDNPCASGIVRVRTIRISYCLVMLTALIVSGCASEHSTQASFADNFRPLVIGDVQSFLSLEPSTQTRVPQVRGSLRNLGNQTLIMVEFTLSFKNRRNQIIFEETAYPIYISSLSHAQSSKPLAPGQQVKFAFKSPTCPKDWQPGQVEVRVTKVVASNL